MQKRACLSDWIMVYLLTGICQERMQNSVCEKSYYMLFCPCLHLGVNAFLRNIPQNTSFFGGYLKLHIFAAGLIMEAKENFYGSKWKTPQ